MTSQVVKTRKQWMLGTNLWLVKLRRAQPHGPAAEGGGGRTSYWEGSREAATALHPVVTLTPSFSFLKCFLHLSFSGESGQRQTEFTHRTNCVCEHASLRNRDGFRLMIATLLTTNSHITLEYLWFMRKAVRGVKEGKETILSVLNGLFVCHSWYIGWSEREKPTLHSAECYSCSTFSVCEFLQHILFPDGNLDCLPNHLRNCKPVLKLLNASFENVEW